MTSPITLMVEATREHATTCRCGRQIRCATREGLDLLVEHHLTSRDHTQRAPHGGRPELAHSLPTAGAQPAN